MIKLDKSSEFRFSALIDTSKEKCSVINISLIDPTEEIIKHKDTYKKIAKKFTSDFVKTGENSGLIISSTSKPIDNDLTMELECFEFQEHNKKTIYNLTLKVSHASESADKKLKQRNRKLEKENKFLSRENKELIKLVEKLEGIKESFRLPFDAIKDLIISFDCQGNVLVVNVASTEWFGQTPHEIVRKKYKTILRQNIVEVVQKVCTRKKTLSLEEKLGSKTLQISYIPTTNRKTGKTEVVMLVQDITKRKIAEEKMLENGRNEGVTIMGGTIRHILNSSLHAILGFAQLASSSYDWPKKTMIKYLKLIERTALRMKDEINKIAEQKEYKTTKYIQVPDTEDCKEILKVELDQDSE
ncbi:MAG: PAS domain S-box protein [Desulfobacteraceae bacterium]|nr:PAS domain S-box protein [Desulfobacteraceae bacterium]